MKFVVLIICISINNCFGQNANGNYLLITNWAISQIKLNKDSSVRWYTKGCTNPGTTTLGTWKQYKDSVHIFLEKRKVTFILRERSLCVINDDNTTTTLEKGIEKSFIRSKWLIHFKAKMVLRKRNRKRNKS